MFAIIGLAAGVFTTGTGLGSGFIMVPGLLYAKLDPRSAAAVSGFIVTFLSSNSLIITLLKGYVEGIATVVYLIMGLIGVLIFANLTYYLMKKYKAHRLVVLIVLIVDILNIISAFVYLGIKIGKRGFDYVMKTGSVCWKILL